jgi:7-cyano-7-deazaguanine synthase
MSQAVERRCVVLLSGGLDSATVLALARADGYACHALSVDYGQRHRHELLAAARVAASLGAAEHRVIAIDVAQFGGSALTDEELEVPAAPTSGIPLTYVPARNTLLLAIALGWAEVLDAEAIHIGVNAIDYSGYPDCRPAFIEQFARLAAIATRAGVEGRPVRIAAPLQHSSKADIVRRGLALGVDFALTSSCYAPDEAGSACGRCDACHLRRAGFAAAGVPDPVPYRA